MQYEEGEVSQNIDFLSHAIRGRRGFTEHSLFDILVYPSFTVIMMVL